MRERRETGGISEEGREILKSIYKCQIIPLELLKGEKSTCENNGSKKSS